MLKKIGSIVISGLIAAGSVAGFAEQANAETGFIEALGLTRMRQEEQNFTQLYNETMRRIGYDFLYATPEAIGYGRAICTKLEEEGADLHLIRAIHEQAMFDENVPAENRPMLRRSAGATAVVAIMTMCPQHRHLLQDQISGR